MIDIMDNKDGIIWLNGDFIPWKQATTHLLNHSLHYSGAVYEGIRCYNSKPFKLTEHIERLFISAKTLNLEHTYSQNDLIDVIQKIIQTNNLTNAYIRPLIFRGCETMSIYTDVLSCNVMICGFNFIHRLNNLEINLKISQWCKPHPKSIPPNCKTSSNYGMVVGINKQIMKDGFNDALFLDYQGFVAEVSCSNIFFVKNDELFTPIADTFLNGITRQTIIQIAKNIGIKTHEVRIHTHELSDFSECFITGTSSEVKPVTSITTLDEKKIEFSKKKIGCLLKEKYIELVSKTN